MGRAYSSGLRERVVWAIVNNGLSYQLSSNKPGQIVGYKPGDIVIMNTQPVQKLCRASGYLYSWRLLIPDSCRKPPDRNPIEKFFAKFTHWLQKAQKLTTETV